MMPTTSNHPINKLKHEKGIEFAPVSIPFSRRLETLAALIWTLTTFGAIFVPIILIIASYTIPYFWHFFIPYMIWFYYDKDTPDRGGRRFDIMKYDPVWTKLRAYFPVKLIKTTNLDPKQNYVFAYHPHGVLSLGVSTNFSTDTFSDLFPGITPYCLTLKSNFYIPFLREYLMSRGCCSVSRESIDYLLNMETEGVGVVLVPGGAREAMYSSPTQLMIHLKSRKGFVKAAIQNGAHLVPVFGFGETEVLLQADNPEGSLLRKFQKKFLQVTGYAPVLFFGRGVFQYSYGFLPLRRPLTTIVGKPIEVKRIRNPTTEEIDDVHKKYMEGLKELYNNHRSEFGDPNIDMIIV